jgi:tetratricopeptide (TPR) repeat protein
LDFVGEFDGIGINVGLRIPLTSDYRLNIGFTHIDKLPSWKIRYWPAHPALTVGFDMAVPRRAKRVIGGLAGPYPLMTEAGDLPVFDDQFSDQFDSTLAMASFMVSSLRDSVVMVNNEMRNLMVRLSAMEQKSNFLEDSLKSLKLSSNVEGKNMNEALRHLSRSLRYFYGGDYRASLQEVESALDLNPNLALAYARRGSIYYKLGDVQRATINWNLALRMDPEYDDVRNILKALHENRLRTTSFVRE